ncbi:hypothetical protein CTA1_584 [Colletotrichum tanaceti]|uniref:Uncharacterized protein n=1 Tax=Colletotrichum tanaceti TaxID=1306861 RepID=A0A4U6X2K8_9PEZI|nr:hypothetical protein CTA1_584 [Colletotrichum tanaceti]
MEHFVGPFQRSIADIIDAERLCEVAHFINRQGPPQRPLQRWATEQLPLADSRFRRRILKLDPSEQARR